MSMPPEIETFFQKWIDWINFDPASAFQKSWNRRARADAAARARHAD